MLQNIQTIETSQFIVRRDGHLDLEWLEGYERATRSRQIHEVGQRAVLATKQALIGSMKLIGKGSIEIVEQLVQASK